MHECALLQEDTVKHRRFDGLHPIIRADPLQVADITSRPPFHFLLVRRMSRYRESTLPLLVATPSAGMACKTDSYFGGRHDVKDIAYPRINIAQWPSTGSASKGAGRGWVLGRPCHVHTCS